ncbi:hypothetical protein MKZ38_009952 [Zalerion maritima]|uniref:Uncharacterized protein n=1 Tax=Zalerion maritima TaxID=339359 RepID=A0AAD5RGB5_9PEZI|nr:hypothetical protein MKZ38_009952 [Zalerion maritima]
MTNSPFWSTSTNCSDNDSLNMNCQHQYTRIPTKCPDTTSRVYSGPSLIEPQVDASADLGFFDTTINAIANTKRWSSMQVGVGAVDALM